MATTCSKCRGMSHTPPSTGMPNSVGDPEKERGTQYVSATNLLPGMRQRNQTARPQARRRTYNNAIGGHYSTSDDNSDAGSEDTTDSARRRRQIRRRLARKQKEEVIPLRLPWTKWMHSDAKNRQSLVSPFSIITILMSLQILSPSLASSLAPHSFSSLLSPARRLPISGLETAHPPLEPSEDSIPPHSSILHYASGSA